MTSVVVTGFGVMLGKTNERLVVRGPRPRLELVEGGPQLFLPLDLPARPGLRVATSEGVKAPAEPLRRPKAGSAPAPRTKPEQGALSGKLDLLILTPDACYPVDFKDTEGGPRRNHRLQLAAYALLAEEAFERPVPDGFIYHVPEKRVVALNLDEADRDGVRSAVADLRRMIQREALPDPPPVRGRCTPCEFRNYCGDVW